MVLSCCDLLAVLIHNPWIAVVAVLFVTEKLDVNAQWFNLVAKFTPIFQITSLLALVVMSFDRYLATSYHIFNRTSVTKKKLLTLFTIFVFMQMTLAAISLNNSVIPFHVYILVIFLIVTPSMLFVNYKLFVVVRKSRRNKVTSPKIKKKFSLRNISSCLLAIAFFMIFVHSGVRLCWTDVKLDTY